MDWELRNTDSVPDSAVRPKSKTLNALCLSFLIAKIGIIILTNFCKAHLDGLWAEILVSCVSK